MDDPCDDPVFAQESPSPRRDGLDSLLLGFPGRDDLNRLTSGNRGVSLDLQNGLKHPVGLFDGDLCGRDDRNFPLDLAVHHEILARQLADEFDDGAYVGFMEIDGDSFLSPLGP